MMNLFETFCSASQLHSYQLPLRHPGILMLPLRLSINPMHLLTLAHHDPSSSPLCLQYLRAMKASPDKLLDLSESDFRDLVLMPGRKRAFPVVVIFTAAGEQYGCTACM